MEQKKLKIKLAELPEPRPLTADLLMLGNIIQSGNNGHYDSEGSVGVVLQIGSLDQEFEQVYCECEESFDWFFRDNYFGVPMEDKWFRIFGFELKTDSAPGIGKFDWWENELVTINSLYRGLWSIAGVESPPIRWVHEFQNSYFLATGKKLVPITPIFKT